MNTDEKRVSPRLENLDPGKNALMPDIYSGEYGPKETVLEIVDESSQDLYESSGFNPYDTAVLYKK